MSAVRRNREREKTATVFSMEEAVQSMVAGKSNPTDPIVGKQSVKITIKS